jgi:TonB dependent receptor.
MAKRWGNWCGGIWCCTWWFENQYT